MAKELMVDHALLVLMPVFNDWAAVLQLLPRLDDVLAEHGLRGTVLIVNDGSTTDVPRAEFGGLRLRALSAVEVLHLRRNLGHQRAIAIGLAYVEERVPCDTIVLMDSDGEDDPRDVPRLLDRSWKHGSQRIVFAERTKRSESGLFRTGYWLYKVAHVLLTGRGIRVGNFSVIPRARLSSLVSVADLWNHYAAAVFTSRQPFDMVPTRRARRLAGASSMNLPRLVTHGLSAMSVYSELIGVRLLLAISLLIAVTVVGIGTAVALRLLTPLAIPGWATTATGLLLIVLLQAIMLAFVFSFVILAGRNGATFLPLRDYVHFLSRVDTVYGTARDERARAHG